MLIIVHEESRGPVEHRFDGDEVIVGRSPSCDLVLDRPFISARHLRILGGHVAHDLGSTNGSFLDGEAMTQPELIAGRSIALGGTELSIEVYRSESAPAPEAPAPPVRDGYTTAPVDVIEAALEPEPEPAPPSPRPIPRSPAPAPSDARGAAALLEHLSAADAAGEPPRLTADALEFFTLEAFRFMRDVETIVSRLAGDLTGESVDLTVVPGSDGGNVMRFLADLHAVPDDAYPREQLVHHLGEVRRWLLESVTVYRVASVKLVDEIRSSLSPLELGRAEPMPKINKALGLQDMVFWKRAQKRLQDLTPDVVAERLDELAREAAREGVRP